MLGLEIVPWLAAALAGVGLLLAVGVVHALAMRVLNDREVHNLRVRATRLRIEQLKRIAQRMREDAGEIEDDASVTPSPPAPAEADPQFPAPPARQAA